MSTRGLPVALCPKLVALITSSADSPPDWSRCACPVGSPIGRSGPVRMLSMFGVVISVDLRILMDVNLML